MQRSKMGSPILWCIVRGVRVSAGTAFCLLCPPCLRWWGHTVFCVCAVSQTHSLMLTRQALSCAAELRSQPNTAPVGAELEGSRSSTAGCWHSKHSAPPPVRFWAAHVVSSCVRAVSMWGCCTDREVWQEGQGMCVWILWGLFLFPAQSP